MAPTNLFQYYQSKGTPLPSISERAATYASAGLGSASEYTGTADQNTALLSHLTSTGSGTAAPAGSPAGGGTNGTPAGSGTNAAPLTPGLTEEDGGSAVSSSDPVTGAINSGQATDSTAQNSNSFASFSASVTPAGGRPALPNYTSQYASLRASQGIDTIEDNINQLTAQADSLQAQLPITKTALLGSGGGSESEYNARMSQEQRDISDQLLVVNNQITAANSILTTKNDFINTVMGYTQQDYTTANNAYETTLSDNMSIVSAFNTQQTKVQNSAQANLQTIYTLIQNSGMTWSQLSPTQQNNVNQLELQAGLPVGTYATFAASKPKATVVSTSVQYDSSGREFTSIISRDPQTGAYSTSNVYAGGQKQYSPDTNNVTSEQGFGYIDTLTNDPSQSTPDGQPYVDPSTGMYTPDGLQTIIENLPSSISVPAFLSKYGSKVPPDALQNPANYGLTPADLKSITGITPTDATDTDPYAGI